MRIAYVTSEVRPFAKTGGLADVAAALPAALAARGEDVTVFAPCYRSATTWLRDHAVAVREALLPHPVPIGGGAHTARYRIVAHGGCEVVLVVHDHFYDRAQLYVDEHGRDYGDNLARFAFLCEATLQYLLWEDRRADVVHVNDWQTSLIPVYLKTRHGSAPLARAASLLTIHNLGYQGRFPAEQLPASGLGWDLFHMEALEFYGQLNLLKGGIVFADAVNAVSPTYAEEIQSPPAGHGLDGVLRKHRGKLSGVLNGIDPQEWDPAGDPRLPAHYAAADRAGKAVCKRELQRAMGLAARPGALLLGSVSRFDVQKGLHLVLEVVPRLDDLDVQLVMLGSGDRQLEAAAARLARAHPERVAVRLGFDDALAHLIEAGADAFLMPSAYEPCGLNQMYSQRYGTVPIVRATGGLTDTVIDATPAARAAGTASGFTFEAFDATALGAAIRRAARLYFEDRAAWDSLAAAIMDIDHSWATRATEYQRLYRRLAKSG
jgi:starch synthase